MQKKLREIPIFKNEDEEREFWKNNSPLDFMDIKTSRSGVFPNLKPTLKSISIRLPENLLEELKILANKQDVSYKSLAKIYLSREILMERRAIQRS